MPTLKFRDGERSVPDHVAAMLRDVETFRLTYEQAMKAANEQLINEEVRGRMTDLIDRHRQEFRGRS